MSSLKKDNKTNESQEKITIVREHPLRVPVSKKNPTGITIRDRHPRRLKGTYLDADEIETIFKNYNRKGLVYPTRHNLHFPDGNKYDETIAIWTDYFNKKFNANPPLDPDIVKALIASESEFKKDPPGNKIAIGIAQITKSTLKVIQDPTGEAKDFTFYKIRQKGLKNPNIAIPIGIRWLFRKKELATHRLKRDPNAEELILEYKGLLKSKSKYKNKALESFRKNYEILKKK